VLFYFGTLSVNSGVIIYTFLYVTSVDAESSSLWGKFVYAGPSFYQSVSKSSILWQVSSALTDRWDILNIWHFYWAACKLCFHSSLARLLT